MRCTSHAFATLARFHRSRVCGNRPRTALKTTNVTHEQIIMAPCTHPGTSREVHEARWPHTCSRPCAFEEKYRKSKYNTKKNTAPKTRPEIRSSPATATTSRRRSTKHVPRVSPCPSASEDPGFVELGLDTALSISENDKCYTYRQTNYNGTLYAPRY